jgi:hypothetical protein
MHKAKGTKEDDTLRLCWTEKRLHSLDEIRKESKTTKGKEIMI